MAAEMRTGWNGTGMKARESEECACTMLVYRPLTPVVIIEF